MSTFYQNHAFLFKSIKMRTKNPHIWKEYQEKKWFILSKHYKQTRNKEK